MIKSIDGTYIFHCTKPGGLPERSETTGDHRNLPENLSRNMLKARLCSMGPGMCQRCGLCEYGKEYLRRVKEGAKRDESH